MPELDHDALIAQLRASGSVFAEEELAVLHEHAERVGPDLRGDAAEILELLVDRRVHGERIEHIVERAQFAELSVHVDFGVFVPRNRTVLLATIVADHLRALRDAHGTEGPPRLLDFGCGSGAIAALAAHRVPGIEVVAVDSDRRAVACAEHNLPQARVVRASSILALVAADATATGVAGAAAAADATEPTATSRISASAPFDVIAANLPYVPTSQLQLLPHGTLESEPLTALDGGEDGLEPLGEHALSMGALLRTGGILVTEVAPHQIERATEILMLSGFSSVELRSDDEIGATALVAMR
ncbi:methyltransferase [Agrococcus sp. ARC_14]|uniref:N5-glutamine methyltransferase family protein n=1 Tax=Agrococcus sp. ARC_14 TaxID=2919927 RepID=UPI001F05F12C|nr:methyltransferase [Agrococcus sp. ARC_14]MCH1883638.1 methyltransferase [Agrococcus sp. ARC_14]